MGDDFPLRPGLVGVLQGLWHPFLPARGAEPLVSGGGRTVGPGRGPSGTIRRDVNIDEVVPDTTDRRHRGGRWVDLRREQSRTVRKRVTGGADVAVPAPARPRGEV